MNTVSAPVYPSSRMAFIGAVFGGIFASLYGNAALVIPGLLYGALVLYLLDTFRRNVVPFDMDRIRCYKAPPAPWTQPDHKFDNSVAVENGEAVVKSPLAYVMMLVFLFALGALFSVMLTNIYVPVTVVH